MTHKKLNLVLDLDETLVNAICFPRTLYLPALETLRTSYKDLYAGNFIIDDLFYDIYFRKGLNDFLGKMSKYYNLYIYSNGTQEYVNNVCKMFKHYDKIIRIFARNGPQDCLIKRLEKYGLNPKTTVIVDDRYDVWDTRNHSNIILTTKFYHHQGKFNNYEFEMSILEMNLKNVYYYYYLKDANVPDILTYHSLNIKNDIDDLLFE